MAEVEVKNRYVAYMDILGWSDKVDSDFGATLELYDELITSVNDVQEISENPPVIRIVSDSIIVVSDDLRRVLRTTNLFLHSALVYDCLLRGGIAFGKHCELANQGNLFVLSEALVAAAKIERAVSYPCVAVHPDLIQASSYPELASIPLLTRLVLFYDGVWLVNPFNVMWLTSAASHASYLKELHPKHAAKYDWFLGLYDTFTSGASMLPESFDAGATLKRWAPAHNETW